MCSCASVYHNTKACLGTAVLADGDLSLGQQGGSLGVGIFTYFVNIDELSMNTIAKFNI